jgi:O-methyltransferase
VQHDLDWSEEKQPWLAIDLETVQEHFKRYELLSESVQFLKGWFADTLPTAPIEKLSILRLDGDLYSSTLEVLEALYAKVTVGGFVIIDDYHALKPCRDAVDFFRQQNDILTPLRRVDWSCVFWRKTQ